METMEERAERLHKAGKLPDRYYYQLVRKSPYEALQEQRGTQEEQSNAFLEKLLTQAFKAFLREVFPF